MLESYSEPVQKGIVEVDYELLEWANPCIKVNKDEEQEGNKQPVRPEDTNPEEQEEEIPFLIEEPNEEDVGEIIRSIFPSRQWDEDGSTWIQYVSTEPSTRTDIQHLTEKLKTLLENSGAQKKGICPIRRNIFSQLMDEMCRQFLTRSVERGILLVRVRDDLRMTMETYSALAESAVDYGRQKAVQAEEGVPELLQEIEMLKIKRAQEEHEYQILEKRFGAQERAFKGWKDREIAKHKRKIAFLKATNEGIQTQWDLITAWKPQNIEMQKYNFEDD